MVVARIGGLMFQGGAGDARYTIESLRGWFSGGADMVRDTENRPLAHGSFPAVGYLTGRAVTLVGLVHASSPYDYERAVSDLEGVLADGGSGVFSVDSAVGVTTAEVSRLGKPDITDLVYGRVARYQVQFWADDPRRYGAARSFSGASVGVFQYGNFPAAPEVTVVGPVAGPYTVSAGGRQFTVTQSLSSGQTHRIDLAAGWVYRNGALQSGVVSRAQELVVPPGEVVTFTGPSSMTVTVVDTYV